MEIRDSLKIGISIRLYSKSKESLINCINNIIEHSRTPDNSRLTPQLAKYYLMRTHGALTNLTKAYKDIVLLKKQQQEEQQ